LLRGRWHAVTPQNPIAVFAEWWTAGRKTLGKADRRCFDSLVIFISWIIWKERNRRTFDHSDRTVEDLVNLVLEEAATWVQAGFRVLETLLLNCGLLVRCFAGRAGISM
jgi:hypothetical protein